MNYGITEEFLVALYWAHHPTQTQMTMANAVLMNKIIELLGYKPE